MDLFPSSVVFTSCHRTRNMHWSPIYTVLQLVLVAFGKSEAGDERNAQGIKCPFNAIDIPSFGHPEDIYKPTFWDQAKEAIRGFIGGQEVSTLDSVAIFSPHAKGTEDCRFDQPPSNIICNSSSPYRNYNGSCNNLVHPFWGISGECQLRLLPASYEGLGGFRRSMDGSPLPNARYLSVNILPLANRPDPTFSLMFVIFGQFIAHDTVYTPSPTRNRVPCCPYNDKNRARPECLPIFARPDDPYYSKFNTTCLTFERSTECPKCGRGILDKFNLETSFLDLSMVYGPNEDQAKLLRLFDGTGRLRFDDHDLLPRNENDFSDFCPPGSNNCFMAGDHRVDQHASLTAFHTAFLRGHNTLALKLKELNPHWEEETLYQEARRILGGQWQHMVYSEYLPVLLGPRHMNHFGLWVGSGSLYNDTSVRTTMWLETSTAGFRLHTMIPSKTGLKGVRFDQTFSKPELIREGCAENLLKGAYKVNSQKFGRHLVEDTSGQFLRLPGQLSGADTGSLDIQRGRDHGLPSYRDMVSFLTGGKTTIATFDSLTPLMLPDNIQLLKKYYKDVGDVDLWLGLQLEKHPRGSAVGFNSATLSAFQFHRLKYGDRFYYEHPGLKTSFTDDQLAALKRSTFSRFLCDNLNLTFIQKNALLLPSYENPIVSCHDLPVMDITPWKTNPDYVPL